jgi:hypothetical protein
MLSAPKQTQWATSRLTREKVALVVLLDDELPATQLL